MNISLVTYGLAALGFTGVSGLLLAAGTSRPLGPSLLFACISTAAWAALIAAGTLTEYPPVELIQFSELTRNISWIVFLLRLLGFLEDGNHKFWLGRSWIVQLTGLALASLMILSLRPLSGHFNWARSPLLIETTVMLWLSNAILILLLVEQIYRNASHEERWGLKFLCLSVGMLFTYDFLMYAEALLFRRLDSLLWQSRGLVVVMTIPWLLVAIARNRKWRMDVHVSRQMVFHTVTLVGAGLYLVSMALIGYFIKYLEGSWGGVLQISFLAAGTALLFSLMFSGQLRARLKVFLSKHFFSYRFDYREEWLQFTAGLATQLDAREGIVRAMARITLSPGGLLLHKDRDGNLLKSTRWELDQVAVEDLDALTTWITESGWIIDLQEFREDSERYPSLELPEWLLDQDSLWLIVPLFFKDELVGVLFLAKTDLKNSLDWEDRDLLKTAAHHAAAILAQQRASDELIEARQFDAFNRLSAYIVHDLKNILAQQSLMVANARKHRHNPEFVDDMILTVDNSVKRMQRLMDQMRTGLRNAETTTFKLSALLVDCVKQRTVSSPKPSLDTDSSVQVSADRHRLSTVFGHLIQNAQEATPDDGTIAISLLSKGDFAVVTIRDSGVGMSESFINDQLFRPFSSTKGLTGMGIGVFESREYIRQLGGDISVHSKLGSGSSFQVTIPAVIIESR